MQTLTSRDNPLVKELRQLAASSQARRKAGRTLLDGAHLAQAYLDHVGLPAICAVAQSALATPEIAAVVVRCEAAGGRCVALADALHASISQVEHGAGLLFVIDTPRQPENGAPDTLRTSALLLDGVQDPGNMGSMLRSAAAAGIGEVFCSPGTVFAWSPKVLRAGMGAHFLLRIREQADLAALIRETQVPVLSTSSHAAASLYELDLARPAAWLFGHEGQGVSPALMALASERVAIPHAGAMESLNVAAAAAVCFFEQARQVRLAGAGRGNR
ncbi:MAG: TrmH family RNA methyltransferase [Burkholderiaceae bacterium]